MIRTECPELPKTSVLTACAALLVATGCGKDPAPTPRPQRAATTVQSASVTTGTASPAAGPELPGGSAANQIFKTRCIVCHGASGHGDGPGAAALKVKPRNYTDGAWQKSVTDADLEKIIVAGGGAVGKDPGMPPNPDLKTKPDVVAGLVEIVRSFAPQERTTVSDAGSEPTGAAATPKSKTRKEAE
jgi:cytochrome c5